MGLWLSVIGLMVLGMDHPVTTLPDLVPLMRALESGGKPQDVRIGKDGQLIVFAPSGSFRIRQFETLDLIPPALPESRELETTAEYINGALVGFNDKYPPVFHLKPPEVPGTVLRVRLVSINSRHDPLRSLSYTVRGAEAHSNDIGIQLRGERLVFTGIGPNVAAVRVFVDGQMAGRVDLRSMRSIDARPLCPGIYDFVLVPEFDDGTICPPVAQRIEIPHRITFDYPASGSLIRVVDEKSSLRVHVTANADAKIAKIRLRLNNVKVAERALTVLEEDIPLKDVPSGDSSVEAVALAADGTAYYAEELPISITNEIWMRRFQNDPLWAELQQCLDKISKASRDVQYYQTRGLAEPEYATLTYNTSTHYLDRFYGDDGMPVLISLWVLNTFERKLPTEKAEFLAKWKAAQLELVTNELRAGEIYRDLGLVRLAKRMFQRVIYDAGSGPFADEAKEELARLAKQ
ncbi:MAG: tetratricopeptide repeat protein [Chthonomonadales bacterium]